MPPTFKGNTSFKRLLWIEAPVVWWTERGVKEAHTVDTLEGQRCASSN